jgi:[protein-PII] uridylyltransferase
MERELRSGEKPAAPEKRPTPRRLRHFKVSTRVHFHLDEACQRTIVELFTTDYPGLLSRVGWVFYSNSILLQNARIATIGSQAEDVFYVTDLNGNPLSEEQQGALRENLIRTLDESE